MLDSRAAAELALETLRPGDVLLAARASPAAVGISIDLVALDAAHRRRCPNIRIVNRAYLTITSCPTTNLGIDMSKPSLQLIHCSSGIRPGAKRRQNGRTFRPFVIHGGARVRSAPGERSWEAALELIDLGFLVFYRNYFAFLGASTTGGPNWADPEKTG